MLQSFLLDFNAIEFFLQDRVLHIFFMLCIDIVLGLVYYE